MKKLDDYLKECLDTIPKEDKDVVVNIVNSIENLAWCYNYSQYIDANYLVWIENNKDDNDDNNGQSQKITDKLLYSYKNKSSLKNDKFFSKINNAVIGKYFNIIKKLIAINRDDNPFISFLIGFCYLNIAELELSYFNAGEESGSFDCYEHNRQNYYLLFSYAKDFINIFAKKQPDDEIVNLLLLRCLINIKEWFSYESWGVDQNIDHYYWVRKENQDESEESKEREADKSNMDCGEWCMEYASDGSDYLEDYDNSYDEPYRELVYSDVLEKRLKNIDNEIEKICNNSHLASLYYNNLHSAVEQTNSNPDENLSDDECRVEDIPF